MAYTASREISYVMHILEIVIHGGGGWRQSRQWGSGQCPDQGQREKPPLYKLTNL